jgi:cupin 2 domain-containing protein
MAEGSEGRSIAESVESGEVLRGLPEPKSLVEEEMAVLVSRPGFHVKRIVSTGHTTPVGDWYDQEDAEWVMVVEGEGVVEWEDGSASKLTAGSWVFIPPHKKHRVAYTSDRCVWLAVHVLLPSP